MPEPAHSYREDLFQWIWQNIEFDCSELSTNCGKKLSIVETGTLNHGAGPDFLNAHLVIDGLEWHGSVEIHKSPSDWMKHRHQNDKNFNSVILHVIYYDDINGEAAVTQSGATLHTLSLKPRLHKSLQQLLEIKNTKSLPCGGQLRFINQAAFEKQVNRAHDEYFEYKAAQLLREYPAGVPISKAWKICLVKQIYHTLGIPANKDQMGQLADVVLKEITENYSLESFIEMAEEKAFNQHSSNKIQWVHAGMRPASRPARRVSEAAALHYFIHHFPLNHFFQNPGESWRKLTHQVPGPWLPGRQRLNLICNTVYLPAIYLLGELLQFSALKSDAQSLWQTVSQAVPAEISKPFNKAGFELKNTKNKLGLAHQFKRYCMERNCHQCEVFKSAIRS